MTSAAAPPTRNATLAAAAAPVAAYCGMSTTSRMKPSVSDTSGPSEDSPGEDDPTSEFEKTALAAKPNVPGRSQRNGMIDSSNASPKTIGSTMGPSSAAPATPAAVTNATERNARSVSSPRRTASVRAITGSSAVAADD